MEGGASWAKVPAVAMDWAAMGQAGRGGEVGPVRRKEKRSSGPVKEGRLFHFAKMMMREIPKDLRGILPWI